mgnify:CR=1 FL=1|jgi:hypothetical protein
MAIRVFYYRMLQYGIGRDRLLKLWKKIPILRNVEARKEHREFPISQSFSDIVHVLALALQYATTGDVLDMLLAYMATDVMFYPSVFMRNRMYLAHHGISVAIIVSALHYEAGPDVMNYAVFCFEMGLLPIAMMDFLAAYGARVPTFMYVLRPAVYVSSRLLAARSLHRTGLLPAALPLLAHNAYVLYLQIRSMRKHVRPPHQIDSTCRRV